MSKARDFLNQFNEGMSKGTNEKYLDADGIRVSENPRNLDQMLHELRLDPYSARDRLGTRAYEEQRIRYLACGGDLYFWASYNLSHASVGNLLGINWRIEDKGEIEYKDTDPKWAGDRTKGWHLTGNIWGDSTAERVRNLFGSLAGRVYQTHERVSDIVYHGTTMDAAIDILSSDTFRLTATTGNWRKRDQELRGPHEYYMCVSRNKGGFLQGQQEESIWVLGMNAKDFLNQFNEDDFDSDDMSKLQDRMLDVEDQEAEEKKQRFIDALLNGGLTNREPKDPLAPIELYPANDTVVGNIVGDDFYGNNDIISVELKYTDSEPGGWIVIYSTLDAVTTFKIPPGKGYRQHSMFKVTPEQAAKLVKYGAFPNIGSLPESASELLSRFNEDMSIKDARKIAASPANYSDEELRLAFSKLSTKALREFPSSPAQAETRAQYNAIRQELESRGQKVYSWEK